MTGIIAKGSIAGLFRQLNHYRREEEEAKRDLILSLALHAFRVAILEIFRKSFKYHRSYFFFIFIQLKITLTIVLQRQ